MVLELLVWSDGLGNNAGCICVNSASHTRCNEARRPVGHATTASFTDPANPTERPWSSSSAATCCEPIEYSSLEHWSGLVAVQRSTTDTDGAWPTKDFVSWHLELALNYGRLSSVAGRAYYTPPRHRAKTMTHGHRSGPGFGMK